jgi:putative glutamine amidotransferase
LTAPLVGITTYHREREGRPRFTLPDAYVEAVRGAGGVPVLLPPGERRPERMLASLDALVLSGGGDLDPACHGGGEHESVYFVCPERDEFEVELVRAALGAGLPLLAICRGMQVLNVALGGDVHLHAPDVFGAEVAHRESQDAHTHHGVELAPDSVLGALLGARIERVASWHHQAVNRLGEGLRATGWAADGLVEAVELDGAPQVLAVQWHPELSLGRDSPQRALLSGFLDFARGRARVSS